MSNPFQCTDAEALAAYSRSLGTTAEQLARETGCEVDEIERMAEDMGYDLEA